MSAERLAAIEGWHPTSATADPLAVCVYHGAKCDTRWLLARLSEAERERDEALDARRDAIGADARWFEMRDERDAARADANRMQNERDRTYADWEKMSEQASTAMAERDAADAMMALALDEASGLRESIARYQDRAPLLIERADTAEIRLSQALAREKALAEALDTTITALERPSTAKSGIPWEQARRALAAHDGAAT